MTIISKTTEYNRWSSMKQRCYNPNNRAYHNYGGRGIKVCERWRNSFEAFLADMGYCPVGLTLDRIDNDGDYEPSNCRWATPKQQRGNRRPVRSGWEKRSHEWSQKLTLNGRSQSIWKWSIELGVPETTISSRKRLGWSDEDALTHSIMKKGSGQLKGRLKLSEADKVAIRQSSERCRDLAQRYGVCASTISNIRGGYRAHSNLF